MRLEDLENSVGLIALAARDEAAPGGCDATLVGTFRLLAGGANCNRLLGGRRIARAANRRIAARPPAVFLGADLARLHEELEAAAAGARLTLSAR